MKAFKVQITPSQEDLLLLNKQFSRWNICPSFPVLKTLSYFGLIYATYTLYMVYLQIQLFMQGTVAYLGLFIFRIVTGLLAALFFFGKFNTLIIRLKCRFTPKKTLKPCQLVFNEKNFEINGEKEGTRYIYGEILRCIHGNDFFSFQTRKAHFLVHQEDLTQGIWSELTAFMKSKKDDFNLDPRLLRKQALRDLEGGDEPKA